VRLNGLLDYILRSCFKYHIKTVIECTFDDQSTRLYSNGHSRLIGRSLRILIRYQKENKPLLPAGPNTTGEYTKIKYRSSIARHSFNLDVDWKYERKILSESICIAPSSALHLFQHPSPWNILKII
jgi:hypothetical protein